MLFSILVSLLVLVMISPELTLSLQSSPACRLGLNESVSLGTLEGELDGDGKEGEMFCFSPWLTKGSSLIMQIQTVKLGRGKRSHHDGS